jgi:hypothetical protein
MIVIARYSGFTETKRMPSATTESVSLCELMKGCQPFLNLKESRAMTVIEIRSHHWGWKAFEASGVEPVFRQKDQAIGYAECRASYRSDEIRILATSASRGVSFNEANAWRCAELS